MDIVIGWDLVDCPVTIGTCSLAAPPIFMAGATKLAGLFEAAELEFKDIAGLTCALVMATCWVKRQDCI